MPWHPCIAADSLADEEVVGLDVAGTPVAIYNLGGSFHATGNICTHQYARMSDGYVEDGCIECPIHSARFEIVTGKALNYPAELPLPVYPVKLEDGQVLVFLA